MIMKTAIFICLSLGVLFLASCNDTRLTNESDKNEKQEKTKQTATVVNIDTTITFSSDKIGNIPIDWSQYFTGKGKSTSWKVLDDNGNNVLAQISHDHPNYHFNEIVFNGISIKDVELEVKIKGVDGKMDQGGGFIWRFADANNYYVVRANPLENNIVLYKVEDGIRTDLPLIGLGKTYGVDVAPLGNGWNTLGLVVLDDIFTVYLNSEQIFQVSDKSFTNAGKIGLWTKADAVTYFDDLKIISIK